MGILNIPPPPQWHDFAACRGHGELFFPPSIEDHGGKVGLKDAIKQREAEAKAICMTCPVRPECAKQGMGEEHGIWGGLTEDERRGLKITSRNTRHLQAKPVS